MISNLLRNSWVSEEKARHTSIVAAMCVAVISKNMLWWFTGGLAVEMFNIWVNNGRLEANFIRQPSVTSLRL